MRFFTGEWLDAPNAAAFREYAAHFDAVCAHLAPKLRVLGDQMFLHDARVTALRANFEACELILELDAEDGQGGLRRIRLQYGGVRHVQAASSSQEGYVGPAGFGDLLYNELDRADELFEHRMLFGTGIELSVVCAMLDLEWTGA